MRVAGLTLCVSIDRDKKSGVKKFDIYAARSGLPPMPNASVAA